MLDREEDTVSLLEVEEEEEAEEAEGPYQYSLMRHSLPVTVTFCVAYTCVLLVGVTGNVMVMMVVVRARMMKTTVFYFLFNLAFADLLVLVFCVPATLIANICTRESLFCVVLFLFLFSWNC